MNGFLSMLPVTLSATLLKTMLSNKEGIGAGEGVIREKQDF